MMRKPMPTACEMRMNSLLSGSGGGLAGAHGSGASGERTGAAVHEEGAFPEKLSGHAVQLLAERLHGRLRARQHTLRIP
jgi:hypothetical protein